MFFERFKSLCESKGTTVTAVLKALKISTSKGTAWKNGSAPNVEILAIIANYFDVSTDYLLGKDTAATNTPATDAQLKFALFGTTEVDDELLEDVKKLAKIQQQLKQQKDNK